MLESISLSLILLRLFGVCPFTFAQHKMPYTVICSIVFVASTIFVIRTDSDEDSHALDFDSNITRIANKIGSVSSHFAYGLTLVLLRQYGVDYMEFVRFLYERKCDKFKHRSLCMHTNGLMIGYLSVIVWDFYRTTTPTFWAYVHEFTYMVFLFGLNGLFIYIRYVAVLVLMWNDEVRARFETVVMHNKSLLNVLKLIDEQHRLRQAFQSLFNTHLTLNLTVTIIKMCVTNFCICLLHGRILIISLLSYVLPDIAVAYVVVGSIIQFGGYVSYKFKC